MTDQLDDRPSLRSPDRADHALTPQQVAFFWAFGFLKVPSLFAADIETIAQGFDEVFATEQPDASRRAVHYEGLRLTISPFFAERSPKLAWIKSDPRLVGPLTSLLGPDYEDNDSDGNIFSCDTGWHSDMFGADLQARLYIKVYFYLDPLRGENGSLRVIPGTNSLDAPFASGVRKQLWEIDGPDTSFGIDPRAIPSWAVETEPGDVVFGDFRTLHAAFDGDAGRRLFTINFSAPHSAADRAGV